MLARVVGKTTKRLPVAFSRRDRHASDDMDGDEGEMGVDEYDDELEDELDDEGATVAAVAVAPKPRRRFVRSGMTSYEQWISRNAMGRRFSRRSGHDAASGEPSAKEESEDPAGEATTCSPSSSSGSSAELSSPCDPAVETAAPVSLQRQTSATSTTSTPPGSSRGTTVSAAPRSARAVAGVSSLSTALNEVLNSQPTALKSVVDRSATPKTVRAFVVEKTPDGNLFVASRRVPDMAPEVPLRPKDDSFLGEGRELPVLTVEAGATTSKDEFFGRDDHKAAAHLVRHSDMEFVYNNRPWTANGRGPAPAPPSFAHDGPLATRATTTSVPAASITPTSTATLTIAAAAQVATGIRRRLSNSDRNAVPSVAPSSNAATRSSQRVLGSMAQKYMDHMRNRSNSNSNRDERLQQKQRSALTAPTSASPNDESMDKGPMTLDELLLASPPKQPSSLPPPPASRPVRQREIITSDGEEDDDNMLMNSFLNVRDIDFMPRKKSTDAVEGLEEGHAAHISDEEEDFPDYGPAGIDVRESDLRPSQMEEPRPSSVSDFLGGFKSRSSMSRNSLGRNSLLNRPSGTSSGRKDDYASRAARSLRNSRKFAAAAAAAKAATELERKLREARDRVPFEYRGDPPSKRRPGFRPKRVRFDPTEYCRVFEVEEPEADDSENDGEIQRWQERDSELGDGDDDYRQHDDDDDDDYGVPIPPAVVAQANAEANADDRRVSVTHRSTGTVQAAYL